MLAKKPSSYVIHECIIPAKLLHLDAHNALQMLLVSKHSENIEKYNSHNVCKITWNAVVKSISVNVIVTVSVLLLCNFTKSISNFYCLLDYMYSLPKNICDE